MREILFRGKRVDNGEWVYGYLWIIYIDNPSKARIFAPKQYEGYDVVTATVGQYTGLNDKNGNKIFEGDILKTIVGCIFSVEWEKEGRFLGFTSERKIVYVNREPKAEVIGNIHDNPELLEDKR